MKTVDMDANPTANINEGDIIIYQNEQMTYDEYNRILQEEDNKIRDVFEDTPEDTPEERPVEVVPRVIYNIAITEDEVMEIYEILETARDTLIESKSSLLVKDGERINKVLKILGFRRVE